MKIFSDELLNQNGKTIKKRSIVLFVVFILLFFFNIMVLFSLTEKSEFKEAAVNQSRYQLTVGNVRGTIYDRNLNPITNSQTKTLAAVIPTPNSYQEITEVFGTDYAQLFESGKPFMIEVPQGITLRSNDIDLFILPDRSKDENYHIIGYTDSKLKGADGLELSYDEYLDLFSGNVSVQYTVNAVNQVISPDTRKIYDQSEKYKGGVVTTLDKKLLNAVKTALEQNIRKGTAIVSKVSTGEIEAIVSTPVYHKENLADAVKDSSHNPLMNRSLYAYEVGSVFKLVTASSALESGFDPETRYTCSGSYNAGNMNFYCNNGIAHGSIALKDALVKSCNGYFIYCTENIMPLHLLDTARSLGLGISLQIAPGISCSKGSLPEMNSLTSPRALANFSFGQGELTATPLQITAMVNAIANNGTYIDLKLIKGKVDSNLTYIDQASAPYSSQVISRQTAYFLQNSMREAVKSGTAHSGKPSYLTAAAKTGTAQTGRYENGEELVNHWYVGFYPAHDPQYTITVMEESVPSSEPFKCGVVFAQIADFLYIENFLK